VSLVIPSLNQGAFLERTLRSVLGQGYPRLQLIVQDGGSSDQTVAVLARYGHALHHWRSAPDDGQAHALNRGFCKAGGEILVYLNADDLLLPGTLAYVGRYFAEHPEVDVVYGHRVVIDADDREIGRWVLPPHDDAALLWQDFIPQETLFWRRHIWERVGGHFDESFHFALDWDLLLRFHAAGARFVRLPRFLGAFRVHDRHKTSLLLDTVGQAEVERLQRRWHGRALHDAEVAQHVRPYLRRHLVLQALHLLGLLRH
jgi:glycosyltransferase involved in cell wall biosynthesis